MEKQNEIDWWWVDYIERELEWETENDLQTLLSFSQTSRDIVKDLQRTKSIVSTADPAHDVILESVDWQKLHGRIMQAADEEKKDSWGSPIEKQQISRQIRR